ncbi:MAG TPA: glycosyltransferase, partial [Vicinamibacterales bacterium]|nr:glycosyltransferase [Vicinamibacterales bacterium]
RRLGVAADAPIALSVGRLTPSKGHRRALEALPHMLTHAPALHWVVLGEGEDRPLLEQLARELNVADRVHVVGYVENPHPFYAAADIYLRTHLLEGENSSSQDAMAFGLPVAGFDTGCGTDCLSTVGHGELAKADDPVALAAAASRLLTQADRGRAAGARGRLHAMTHFDLQSGLRLFDGLYRDLARPDARRLRGDHRWDLRTAA